MQFVSAALVVEKQSPTRGCNKCLAGSSTSCECISFYLFIPLSFAIPVLWARICECKLYVLTLQFWLTWGPILCSCLQLSQCLQWKRSLCLNLKVSVLVMMFTCSYVQTSSFGSACVSTSFHVLPAPSLGNGPLWSALGWSECSPSGWRQNWASIKKCKE